MSGTDALFPLADLNESRSYRPMSPSVQERMSTRPPDLSFLPAGADEAEADPPEGVAAVAFLVDTERDPLYGDVVAAEHLSQSRLSRWQEQR